MWRGLTVAMAMVLMDYVSAASIDGHYFFRHDVSSSTLLCIPSLTSFFTRNVVECSKECVKTSNCAFVSFNGVTKLCHIGSGNATGNYVDVDVSTGTWRIYLSEGVDFADLNIIDKTPTTTSTSVTSTTSTSTTSTITSTASTSTSTTPSTTSSSTQVPTTEISGSTTTTIMQGPCMTSWGYYNFSCYRYFDVNDQKHWNQSNFYCSTLHNSAHLAVITDVSELSYVVTYLDSVTSWMTFEKIWVGGTDFFSSEGVYEWVNGEAWTWALGDSSWYPGEPNDVTNSIMEDCIALDYKSSSSGGQGQWIDDACFNTHAFICEYELNVTEIVR